MHPTPPDRRQFLHRAAALTAFTLLRDWARAEPAADKLGPVLPLRQLLRDGTPTTAFCLGGYHVGKTPDAALAQRLIERALELGVRFFDNARMYYEGRAEEYYGRFLVPRYREHVFLMTKSHAASGAEARQELEASRAAMKADVIDLWQVHGVSHPAQIDERAQNGVLDAFLEAKASGKVRHLGFTGHVNPRAHLHFLDLLMKRGLVPEFETCQMPLNLIDPGFASFQENVLPVLLEMKLGVIAMKTMAGGGLLGRVPGLLPAGLAGTDPSACTPGLSLQDLHHYVYSLPVSSLCSGCESVEQLEQNISALSGFKNLSTEDMTRLAALARPHAGMEVENYKRVLDAGGSIMDAPPPRGSS
jgi:uncharacterized protein